MDYFDFSFLDYYQPQFIDGVLTTVEVSMVALLLSVIIGTIIAIFRISGNKVLGFLGAAYVEFFRNTPLVVQIFFVYYGLPSLGLDLPKFWVGSLGLSIYTGAFIAEVIRAGILTVPKGQMEAARASGLSFIQTMINVILPQAFKIVVPPLGNQFINLVKNSSILTLIAAGDILYQADSAIAEYSAVPVLIFTAALYLCLTIPLTLGVNALERYWAKQGAR